jgi:hypothetical protein
VQAFCFRISAVALLTALTLSTCSALQVQGVPEIDAGSGATALTLVAGAILWVRQARRSR